MMPARFIPLLRRRRVGIIIAVIPTMYLHACPRLGVDVLLDGDFVGDVSLRGTTPVDVLLASDFEGRIGYDARTGVDVLLTPVIQEACP